MKKGIVLLLLMGLFISCHKREVKPTNALVGTWKMVASLSDPGDGSGVFIDVESDKVLEFNNDSIVTSNGTICSISALSDTPSTGIYHWDTQTITSSCTSHFYFNSDKTVLTLYFPGREPIGARFEKIQE